jgi:Ca2+-binding RTX toxin-like protein
MGREPAKRLTLDRPWRRARSSFALLICLLASLAIAPTSAGAATAPCLTPATTSPDGTVLYVSPCAGEVVVSSPQVRTVYGSRGDDIIKAALNVETVYAGEGNDTVYAGPETVLIEGGAGEDTIYGEPLENEIGPEEGELEYEPEVNYETATPAIVEGALGSAAPQGESSEASASIACTENPCLGGIGDQELVGGEGNDQIFGERGNDILLGEGGNDALYGGIGDDEERGGPGDDFIAGGGGADTIFGEGGEDLVRGDGTIDTMSGGPGTDTVSFSTGVTPGFEGAYPAAYVPHVSGFPESESGEGRGVYVRLDGGGTTCGYAACDNGAGLGGGADSISEVENVIGTAFPDIIVGSSGANKIYGGGGGDVIIGAGGADELYGGAEGDFIQDNGSGTAYGGKGTNNCVTVATKNECTGSEEKVTQHEAATMSAGIMMVKNPVAAHDTVYLVGSEGNDEVNAHYVEGENAVTFTSYGSTTFSGESEGCTYESSNKKAKCILPAASPALDAVVLAGMNGNDHFSVGGEPKFALTSNPVLLGGQGNDTLVGSGSTEDTLVDGNGTGSDKSQGFGYDDWLLNNPGADTLEGGMGNDLLLSVTLCDGDTLQGGEAGKDDGEAKNDASWAKLPAPAGVTADIETQSSGSSFDEGTGKPACAEGSTDSLFGIDDLEGSNQSDALFGGEHENLLIGHLGEDNLRGELGADKLNAVDGGPDKVNGGGQPEGTKDECIIDLPADKEVSGCEEIKPEPVTHTTLAEPEAHNGEPGSVTVKGNVEANGSLSGYKVRINFSKEEKGEWVLKSNPEVTLPENGNYTDSEGVGAGSWRVKAVFFAQSPYLESESSYKFFTISK